MNITGIRSENLVNMKSNTYAELLYCTVRANDFPVLCLFYF
jgi:hypothetical protein